MAYSVEGEGSNDDWVTLGSRHPTLKLSTIFSYDAALCAFFQKIMMEISNTMK